MQDPKIRAQSNDDVAWAEAIDWQSTLSRSCWALLCPCCARMTSWLGAVWGCATGAGAGRGEHAGPASAAQASTAV